MRIRLIEDLLHHLDKDGELGIGDDTHISESEIETLPLPEELKQIVQMSWPQKYAQFGPIEIFDLCSILEESCLSNFLNKALLPIGKAGNGDMLVINFSDAANCPVGYIRLFNFNKREPDLGKDYFQIESSLERFLFRAAERLYLPSDSYACEQWEGFARECKPKEPS